MKTKRRPVRLKTFVDLSMEVFCILFRVCDAISALKGAVAQEVLSDQQRRLLSRLHEVGAPPLEALTNEDQPSPTSQRQAEEYYRLLRECAEAHVSDWRVRWAAPKHLFF